MISLLSRFFIKDKTGDDAAARRAYGSLCSAVGIALNIVLFALKYIAGVVSGSIAITADAFNNLSDAGSSVITLIGLKLAGKKPDREHPFGHGRLEYLSGLAVSVIIIVVGVELFRSSLDKILNPETVSANALTFIILGISIAVKGYMFFYNRRIGEKINSAGMKATAIDSIGDAVATTVVLLSSVIAYFTDIRLDGWCGILVALFILYAGIKSVRETIDPLLGGAPEQGFVDDIKKIVLSYERIHGIHDLIVHDYGPGRVMVSLHVEVNGSEDIYELHEIIDNIENRITEELKCAAVIHMDPIDIGNENMAVFRAAAEKAVHEIDENISIHDFRIVPGTGHTNLIFDAVIPFSITRSEAEIKREIAEKIHAVNEKWHAVVNIDRPFVS